MNKDFELLKFETKLFGYKVAKINPDVNYNLLKQILQKLKDDGFKLVYLIILSNDKNLSSFAKKNKGVLIDEKVLLKKSIAKSKYEIDSHIKSYHHKSLNNQIESLALQSGYLSRYQKDENFINHEFEKLYKIWIEKSLNGDIAFDVLVYLDEGKEEGLITIEKNENKGNIGIISVSSDSRRQSIGEKLIMSAFNKFQSKNINQVFVSTQKKNKIALSFYKKLGFSIERVEIVYHFWLS